ncbi:MAG: FkbM family methyltransferase [Saprospiraceae bacterium]|nr:FkbM family methyltransferase [Saprospiraceae bacterium]
MINNLYCRVLNRLNYFRNRIVIISRNFYGRDWKIPIIDELGYGYSNGINTEIWIYNLLNLMNSKSIIKNFIDVGVNIGQTYIKIKSIAPDVKYFGFDPSTICISYMQKLDKLNNSNLSSFFNIGLSDKNDIMILRGFGEGDSRASLSGSQINEDIATHSVEVLVFKLDTINLSLTEGGLTILKIDVEGYELEVLKGANTFINEVNPVIIFEVLPHHDNTIKIQNAKALYNFLIDLGYVIWHINQDSANLQRVYGFNYNKDNYDKTDFIAVKDTIQLNLQDILAN